VSWKHNNKPIPHIMTYTKKWTSIFFVLLGLSISVAKSTTMTVIRHTATMPSLTMRSRVRLDSLHIIFDFSGSGVLPYQEQFTNPTNTTGKHVVSVSKHGLVEQQSGYIKLHFPSSWQDFKPLLKRMYHFFRYRVAKQIKEKKLISKKRFSTGIITRNLATRNLTFVKLTLGKWTSEKRFLNFLLSSCNMDPHEKALEEIFKNFAACLLFYKKFDFGNEKLVMKKDCELMLKIMEDHKFFQVYIKYFQGLSFEGSRKCLDFQYLKWKEKCSIFIYLPEEQEAINSYTNAIKQLQDIRLQCIARICPYSNLLLFDTEEELNRYNKLGGEEYLQYKKSKLNKAKQDIARLKSLCEKVKNKTKIRMKEYLKKNSTEEFDKQIKKILEKDTNEKLANPKAYIFTPQEMQILGWLPETPCGPSYSLIVEEETDSMERSASRLAYSEYKMQTED